MSAAEEFTSQVGFHTSNALHIMAQRYPTVLKMLLEIIQNVIDSGATRAEMVINLKDNKICVQDNGAGCSREQFDKAVKEIGMSQKTEKVSGRFNALGQFGIGIAAPVGKCRGYTFISCPKVNKGQADWEGYSTHDFGPLLSPTSNVDGIPGQAINPANMPWWNTQVRITGLTQNKQSATLDLRTLLDEAGVNFGEALRKRISAGRPLNFKITFKNRLGKESVENMAPLDFRGKKLERIILKGKQCGSITMQLYLCDKPAQKRLLVQVGGSDFQVSWDRIAVQAGGVMNEDALQVLGSGHLEGSIKVDKCELLPERTGLVEDDSFVDFLTQINEWAEGPGFGLVESVRSQQKNTRYLNIGHQVVNMVEGMFDRVDFMKVALADFAAAVSGGHAEVKGKEGPASKQTREPAKDPGDPAEPGQSPQKEQPGRSHSGVVDPEGRRKTYAKSQKGFNISFEEMPGSGARYEVDQTIGKIAINYRHPDFAAVEGSDAKLRQYVLQLVLFAIASQAIPEGSREQAKVLEGVLLPWQIFLIGTDGVSLERRAARTFKA